MTTSARHVLLDDLPRQARTLVRVSGEDGSRFLQGLLTADVGELTPGQATAAALLTVKGKIVSELWVLAVVGDDGENEPWLAIPAELGEAVTEDLDAHIIMDDVELERLEGHGCALIWGEGAAELELKLGAELRRFTCAHPLPGVLVIGSKAALLAALEAGASEAADAEAFTAERIKHARPAWGFELRADRFPPEVGFVDAVSYDKGCYLGQEPLSRIHNRGKVNRVMVRVRATALPEGEGPIALSAGDKAIGEWTSWVGEGSGAVGLAIVRRSQASAGTKLRAGTIEVEVRSGPLGDDPGGGGRKETGTLTLGGRR